MIDRSFVRARLKACRLYLDRLRPLAAVGRAAFSADHRHHHLAERLVQLIVDAAVDVNNHLLVEAGAGPAPDYYSSFAEMGRMRVLGDPLARRLAATAGLRNRLVHGYESVDLKILHRGLRPMIRDYDRYIAAVRRRARC